VFGIFKRKHAKQFGEIAVKKGLASEKDIQEALETQKDYLEKHKIHKAIGAILTEKGILEPNDVETILKEQESQTSLMAWFYALFGMSR
jgi:hypothetical protein